jgi:hypothetical protein
MVSLSCLFMIPCNRSPVQLAAHVGSIQQCLTRIIIDEMHELLLFG